MKPVMCYTFRYMLCVTAGPLEPERPQVLYFSGFFFFVLLFCCHELRPGSCTFASKFDGHLIVEANCCQCRQLTNIQIFAFSISNWKDAIAKCVMHDSGTCHNDCSRPLHFPLQQMMLVKCHHSLRERLQQWKCLLKCCH